MYIYLVFIEKTGKFSVFCDDNMHDIGSKNFCLQDLLFKILIWLKYLLYVLCKYFLKSHVCLFFFSTQLNDANLIQKKKYSVKCPQPRFIWTAKQLKMVSYVFCTLFDLFFCNNMVDEILIMVKVILLKWRQNFLQVSRILFSVLSIARLWTVWGSWSEEFENIYEREEEKILY